LEFCEYKVRLLKDEETGQVVAEIPALGIADYGLDSQQALKRLQQMVTFHLECLRAEGQSVPKETRTGRGLYLKVPYPLNAA
jgi:predicted RNase H-like HicB family nuclease